MQEFEAYLRSRLPLIDSFHPDYETALHAMLLAGGKRFRPRLLLAVVRAYEPLLEEGAMAAAAALEILHTYSLIHDDLPAMDDAALRRGVATLHTRYDEALAILVGDALNTYAFELLARAPLRADVRIALVAILAENGGVGGMVLGQALDLHFENRSLELEQVEELHRNKTAKLIAASLEMGAVIVDLPEEKRRWLRQFGMDLGLLFQVQDDILDAVKSSEEAGKPTGSDEAKNSFVTLLGLEAALGYADDLAERIGRQLQECDAPLRGELDPLIGEYLRRHRN